MKKYEVYWYGKGNNYPSNDSIRRFIHLENLYGMSYLQPTRKYKDLLLTKFHKAELKVILSSHYFYSQIPFYSREKK